MRKTDTEKFANLIMMYQDDMYYLALSICKNEADAQDIVGETIVKAFEARNQLRNDARFKYWIMKILTNTASAYLTRIKLLLTFFFNLIVKESADIRLAEKYITLSKTLILLGKYLLMQHIQMEKIMNI